MYTNISWTDACAHRLRIVVGQPTKPVQSPPALWTIVIHWLLIAPATLNKNQIVPTTLSTVAHPLAIKYQLQVV